MDRRLSTLLEECLQELDGGADLESVLARHPGQREALLPLLAAAQSARDLGRAPLPPNAMTLGRARLLQRAAGMRRQRRGVPAVPRPARVAFAAALVVAFLALAGGGLVTASANALPGDPLYGVKRAAERVQLDLTFDTDKRTRLENDYYNRRIQETESLLEDGRLRQVEFAGLVTARLDDGWLVSGIRVATNAQTEIEGEVRIGAHVEVRGETQADDSVLAGRIRVEDVENGGGGSSGSGADQETAVPGSDDQSPGDGQGESTRIADPSGGEGGGDSGSGGDGNSGPSDPTHTPEPTRTPKPSKTPEPTRTQEPTRTGEPSKTPEPDD